MSAQFGVTPILLVVFGSVPLVTPVTNLLAAPAAAALGAYGLLASGVAGIVPPLGPLVQQPCALLVAWVTRVAEMGAAPPLEVGRRGACAIVALGAAAWAASVACTRARRALPDDPAR
jgi:hypothetical protein